MGDERLHDGSDQGAEQGVGRSFPSRLPQEAA